MASWKLATTQASPMTSSLMPIALSRWPNFLHDGFDPLIERFLLVD